MKAAPFLVAGAVLGIATMLTVPTADAKVRVVPFAKAGNWNVRAVFSSSGAFDHCSANARYRSGTRVSIIVYRSGNWRLWFAHNSWPDRGRATFDARVVVDNRVVLNQTGRYKGRNAYIDLGRQVDRVKALMRGRSMAIVTPAGTSRFSLTGTNRATREVARCWTTSNRRRSPDSGAFGSANANRGGGAFGSRSSINSQKFSELSRANTLEIATQYLSKAKQPYAILPRKKGPLKHFPVNWRFQDGAIGGMRVFRNARAGVGKLLGTLLSDQAKNCRGRNASEREPDRRLRGRNIASATGICQGSDGQVVNTKYKVAEIGQGMVMVIMELRSRRGAGGQIGSNTTKPQSQDSEIRIPGPNEL